MERTIARCRILLSIVALTAIYLDPTRSAFLPGLDLRGGPLTIDPSALAVLLAHLATSVAIYAALAHGFAAERVASLTTWTDVLFAGAIAAVTEGVSSPFYVFFVFAVMTSGFRGARRVAVVIGVSVAMYLSLILVSGWSHIENFYVMRPVYLAVVGYLIAYLGHERAGFQAALQRLEADAERSRIASNLHDGSLQTLVAVGLQLEGCRGLLQDARYEEALDDLRTLQEALAQECDGLRSYVRDLASVGPGVPGREMDDPFVACEIAIVGPASRIDDVLQIAREALANVKRHARARSATISVRTVDGRVLVTVDDDGVGFPPEASAPWSIACRVQAAGGELRIDRSLPGAHLQIALPGTAVEA